MGLLFIIAVLILYIRRRDSGPSLHVGDYGGTALYDSPEEEERYRKLGRLQRMKERWDERLTKKHHLSLKAMQKLKDELDKMK